MIFSETKVMELDHEGYLAWVLAMQVGSTVAGVLHLGHEGLVHPAQPPVDHLWVTDRLRRWLGEEGCQREGLSMWFLRRRRGTVG